MKPQSGPAVVHLMGSMLPLSGRVLKGMTCVPRVKRIAKCIRLARRRLGELKCRGRRVDKRTTEAIRLTLQTNTSSLTAWDFVVYGFKKEILQYSSTRRKFTFYQYATQVLFLIEISSIEHSIEHIPSDFRFSRSSEVSLRTQEITENGIS